MYLPFTDITILYRHLVPRKNNCFVLRNNNYIVGIVTNQQRVVDCCIA